MISTHTPDTLSRRTFLAALGAASAAAPALAADAPVAASATAAPPIEADVLVVGGENAMHVPGADSSTAETHSKANIDGRQSLLRMLRFLRSHPGFERLKIERLQPETGVRETYRIDGETRVTADDYTSGRVFPDAVAHAFYPAICTTRRASGRGTSPRALCRRSRSAR